MKRILFVGGYGYKDLGDESQLTAVLVNMRRFIPDSHFLLLTESLEYTRSYHKEKTDFSLNYYLSKSFLSEPSSQNNAQLEKVRSTSKLRSIIAYSIAELKNLFLVLALTFNAKRLKNNKRALFLPNDLKHFLNILKNSNLLFVVGGGNLTSIWRSDLRYKCLTFILCRLLEKPIILSGQTIGPFYGRLDKLIARYALDRVNLITLREKFSERSLREIGVTKPLIRVTADNSTTLIPAHQIKIRRIMAEAGIDVSSRLLIGINIVGLRYLQNIKIKFKKSKEILAQIADYLISKHNASIIFVPMQYGADDDRIPIREIVQLMQNKHKAFILSQEYDDKTIKGLIAQLDLAIGFRYHFIVFAVTSGVPAIGIYLDHYYSIKIKGILDLVGQKKNALNIEEASLENLMALVEEIFSNREHNVIELRERTKMLEERSLTSIKFAAEILSQKS